MTVDVITAVLLIVVPIAFNLAFFELGRAFDYPNILRREPDEIMRRFAAGGSGLLLRWHALLLSALAMLPLVALLAVLLAAPPALTALSVLVGAAAALVQALGLHRLVGLADRARGVPAHLTVSERLGRAARSDRPRSGFQGSGFKAFPAMWSGSPGART